MLHQKSLRALFRAPLQLENLVVQQNLTLLKALEPLSVLSLSAGCRQNSPAEFLASDESVKHNGHFTPSLSRLNLIFSRQPNFSATTLLYYLFNFSCSSLGLVYPVLPAMEL